MRKPRKTKARAPVRQLTTVIDHVITRLRKLIMTGELRPGQKLIEADLCEQLSVSRASIREALRILAKEHLIELIPNRGPSVAKLGWKEVEDIHDVWAMLTSEAVYRFAGRASAEDLEAVVTAYARLQLALKEERAIEQLAATNALFGTILDHCGNETLIEIVYSLVSRLNFLRAQALRYEGWGHLCIHEIGDIIAALQAKNAPTARDATRRHIDSACAAAKQVALVADAEPATGARRR
jgi:DNA-binding GntR family transcriptional regulator